MKTLNIMIVTACIATLTFAQLPLETVKERVDNPEILKDWKLGELKALDNVTILRLEGENGFDHHTNLLYTSNKNMQRLVVCKAENEGLTAQEKLRLLEFYLDEAPGGQLSLFFDRVEKRLADPRLFTVEVIDSYSGEKVFGKVLDNEEPYYYEGGVWYYYKTINVPYSLEKEFVVKVVDKGLNKTFKFHVSIQEDLEEDPLLLQDDFILSQLPF